MTRRRAYLLTAILLLASLGATLLAWQAARAGGAREREALFALEVDRARRAIQERIQVHAEALHALRALFAQGPVERDTWLEFAGTLDLQRRFPGLHRLSFNRRIARADVPAFEARLRADPLLAGRLGPGFAVRPIPNENEAGAPADVLYAIEYTWPDDARAELLGVDVYADPVRRAVIERLRGSVQPLATPRVAFLPAGTCFVIMVAVEPGPGGGDAEGVLVAVYLPHELAAHALQEAGLSAGVSVAVYDGETVADEARLYANAADAGPAPFVAHQTIDVYGQPWTLVTRASPAFAGAGSRSLPLVVLVAGLVTSVALSSVFLVLATAHARASTLARAMTQALEQQRALELRSDRLRSLGEMAAGMAHELNQPLSGVRGQAEHALLALERGWELAPERLRAKLQAIVAQADRMTHIIEHVRLFSREAGRPQQLPVDVAEVAAAALALFGAQMRARGVELELRPPPGPLAPVRANPFSLEEVVLNLLANARDAVEERRRAEPDLAGPHVVLATSAGTSAGAPCVRLTVEDRGSGIAPEVLARVFEPFFTTKGPDRGTGLGLSIARALVEEAGGKLTLESGPTGTRAVVELPACAEAAHTDAARRPDAEAG